MANHVMDVVFGCLPLILYIAILQYESKHKYLKMFEMKCEEAKARRKKNGSHGRLFVNALVTNSSGECYQ